MKRRPWYKHYAMDWLGHPLLRQCSLAARGLLEDLMCLAHLSDVYGHVRSSGVRIGVEDLPKIVQSHPRTVRKAFEELVSLRRVVVESDGTIVIPRMVRDGAYRQKQSDLGKKGGNPALGQTLKAPLKPESESESDTDTDISRKKGVSLKGEGRKNGPGMEALAVAEKLTAVVGIVTERRLNGTDTAEWAELVGRLLRQGVTAARQIKAITWYGEHHGERGVPEITQPMHWQAKFAGLEGAIRRWETGAGGTEDWAATIPAGGENE